MTMSKLTITIIKLAVLTSIGRTTLTYSIPIGGIRVIIPHLMQTVLLLGHHSLTLIEEILFSRCNQMIKMFIMTMTTHT